jgi:hypothetical protein
LHAAARRTLRMAGGLSVRIVFWFTATFVFLGLVYIIVIGGLHR